MTTTIRWPGCWRWSRVPALAAGREAYPFDELQYLFPIRSLQLYGPSAPSDGVLDPQQQDNKTDFQKQNVASFLVADTQLIRGIASAGAWSGPFLRLSYRAGPDSVLAGMARASLGPTIRLLPEGRTERDAGAVERAVRRRDRALCHRTLGMAGHVLPICVRRSTRAARRHSIATH